MAGDQHNLQHFAAQIDLLALAERFDFAVRIRIEEGFQLFPGRAVFFGMVKINIQLFAARDKFLIDGDVGRVHIRFLKEAVATGVIAVTMGINDNQRQIRNLAHNVIQVFPAVDGVDHRRLVLAADHIANRISRIVDAGDFRRELVQNRSSFHRKCPPCVY